MTQSKKVDTKCRQDNIVSYIEEFTEKNGFSPSFREIGNGVGLRSTSSVHQYIEQLVSEGRLRGGSLPRTLTVVKK